MLTLSASPIWAQTVSHSQEVVVVMGSSTSWVGGNGCDNADGWTYWFAKAYCPGKMRSYARSGATWTHTAATKLNTKDSTALLADDNVMYNQVARLLEDVRNGRMASPTLALLYAGTNDVWFEIKRAGALKEPVDEALSKPYDPTRPMGSYTGLASSIGLSVGALREAFPGIRIVLITPTEITKVSEGKTAQVGDYIERCGRRLGVEVIRMDRESPIRRAEELKAPHYTRDGVHPTREASKMTGQKIAKMINK